MQKPKRTCIALSQAVEHLVSFSLDGSDLNHIRKNLPQNGAINPVALEYESRLLKIIGVGWALSYLTEGERLKENLTQTYWSAIQAFSHSLSSASSMAVGEDIDYFELLKSRLGTYLNAFQATARITDPLTIIGPTFAGLCADGDNALLILAGNKLFHLTINGVRQYLDSIDICADDRPSK